MNTIIDWTSRRTLDNIDLQEEKYVNLSVNAGEKAEEIDGEKEDDSPFSFVKRQKSCKLSCCSAFDTAASLHGVFGAETLSARMFAVIFIPPWCSPHWLSGIASSTRGATDDDPFMESVEVNSVVAQHQIYLQGHEEDIDDCLKCSSGGYQHFR